MTAQTPQQGLPLCTLCRQDAMEVNATTGDARDVRCRRCGRYRITGPAQATLDDGEWGDKRWLLAAVTRNASAGGGRPITLTTDTIPQLIETAPLPDSPMEVMERLLLGFAHLHHADGSFYGRLTVPHHDFPLYYLPSVHDLRFTLEGLAQLGYIKGLQNIEKSQIFTLE